MKVDGHETLSGFVVVVVVVVVLVVVVSVDSDGLWRRGMAKFGTRDIGDPRKSASTRTVRLNVRE